MLAGRKALRIDTTVTPDTRERYVHETLERLGAKAEPRAIAAMAESAADLGAIGNDLEKLALTGTKIGELRDRAHAKFRGQSAVP